MSYFVYVLKSESTGQFYIGQTDNLIRRIAEHNDSDYRGTEYTKRHKGPWACIYKEEFKTRSEAMKREKELKAKKSKRYLAYLINYSGC